ncbi:MAG: glycoside hydrolase family 88 protein [Oscillospiraceae bacterium]|nr:glycoside hydrolase family 88 protein [Oscillospiraceae bacterium]
MNVPSPLMITEEFLRRELDFCREKIEALLPRFQDCFPAATTEHLVYPAERENFEWTTSFLSGMLWLLYRHNGNAAYLPVLQNHLESFYHRVEDPGYLDTHDLGFLYSLSCYPAVLLRRDQRAEACFLKAAAALRRRYFPQAGIIQAWGNLEDPANRGRMIIDCLLNLPLLYQAARFTGDRSYWEAAYSHAKQAQRYLVRPDSSTYHTFFMDVETGAPRFGRTAQGYSDSSCWSRGQAWGVYGFALSYRHTGDRSFLDTACRLLDYYLEHLPEDGVCYWDLCFTLGEEPRDSSAAAIVCCGILELLKHLPLIHPRRGAYAAALERTMLSLSQDYSTRSLPQAGGLLLHGVYSKPAGQGVDESTVWGDYYYVEALYRLLYGSCGFWS